MANVGLALLGSLRTQAEQRADMVNSGFVTVVEWNQYLTSSYKELYDLLIASYGDDYNVALPYRFVTSGSTQLYPLPDGSTTVDAVSGVVAAALYKLIGMDLQVTTTPDSWVTLRRFEFTERNQYLAANQQRAAGYLPLRYKIVGSNFWVTPLPASGPTLQAWYIPKPTNLQPVVSCGTTSGSAVVTTSDTTQLAVGMNVADLSVPQGISQVVPDNTTISSIVAGVSFTMSANATATKVGYLLAAWSDATSLDGISGWEEYVVIDAAMKALIKEESSNVQEVMAEKMAMKARIEAMAANRDAGLPARVSDAQSLDSWPYGGGFGGDGWGW